MTATVSDRIVDDVVRHDVHPDVDRGVDRGAAGSDLSALRARAQRSQEAATTARIARTLSHRSARLAGSLADRRAAADAEVAAASRRLRAVRGIRPARLGLLIRGRSGPERERRAAMLRDAVRLRDEIAGRARAFLDDAESLRRQADAAVAQAAALPRLLDEIARRIETGGGLQATRLAVLEQQIGPAVTCELALTDMLRDTGRTVRTVRRCTERLAVRIDAVELLIREITDAVTALRADVPATSPGLLSATDAWLTWIDNQTGAEPLDDQRPLEQVRMLLASLNSAIDDMIDQRAQVREVLAVHQAARTALLRGEGWARPAR